MTVRYPSSRDPPARRLRPKVLKFLPGDKAKDAKSFMMSFQYWLGGSPENLEAFLLMIADK